MLTKALILDESAAAGPEMTEKITIEKHTNRVFFIFVSPPPMMFF
jgi:hypothetical protein